MACELRRTSDRSPIFQAMTQRYVSTKVTGGATVTNASAASVANKVHRGDEHFKQIVTPARIERSAAAVKRVLDITA